MSQQQDVLADKSAPIGLNEFADQSSPLTAIVGRRDERDELNRSKRAAWSGLGQVVVMSGEAGIGKSRLVAWLVDQLNDKPVRTLSYKCSRHHRDSPLYPFAEELLVSAGIDPASSASAKLEKLQHLIELRLPNWKGDVSLFAELLGIRVAERDTTQDLNAGARRRQTFDALAELITAGAEISPVLVVFEDAHWTDATSFELIGRLIERIGNLRVLLVVTSRPELLLRWPNASNLSLLELERLDDIIIRKMIADITKGEGLPLDIAEIIVAKSDGIPLFAEELTKAFLNADPPATGAHVDRRIKSRASLAIPDTLQDTLMASVDRLGAAKQVAQIGAVIGRDFSRSLVALASSIPDERLSLMLETLEQQDIVTRRGLFDGAIYTFRHALIQDAAYASLLQSDREKIHRDIADAILTAFPSIAASEPETIGYHLSEASMPGDAVKWWAKAGESAFRSSAYDESVGHYEQAVAQEAMRHDASTLLARIQLRVALGHALVSARGFADPATIASFEEALSLAASIGDITQRFGTYYGLWMGSVTTGTGESMRFWANEFLDLAKQTPDAPELCIGHRMSGVTAFFAGEYASARYHLETAVAVCHPDPDLAIAARYQVLQSPMCKINLAMLLAPLGERTRALRLADDSVAEAAASKHFPSIAFAMGHRFSFDAISGDLARCEQSVADMETFYRTFRVPIWQAWIDLFAGWTSFQRGDHEAGLARVRSGLIVFGEQGLGRFLPFCHLVFVKAKALVDVDAAIALLDERTASLGMSGEHWFDAELHRHRGELQVLKHDFVSAEADCKRALDTARHQGAKAFELRAIASLAGIYTVTKRQDKAIAILTEALADVPDEALAEGDAIGRLLATISNS